ncbi:MAG: thioredoxin-disulfide reductase [Archaeoglobaceae archaeon]
MFEVAIVGAGPAGLTAAIYSARFGLKTIFFETFDPVSQLSLAGRVENYPGFEGSGIELLDRMKKQALKAGAESKVEKIDKILKKGDNFVLIGENEYEARAVIIATGGKHREAGVQGENDFIGKGVSYCATCDGNFFKGKRVIVYGSGKEAVSDAIYLHDLGCKVSLLSRSPLRVEKAMLDEISKRGIEVLLNANLKRIEGTKKVERVAIFLREKKEELVLETDGVFIAIGMRPATDIVAELGVERDHLGYIKVDKEQRTNVKGIFAAGDCCSNPLKQVVTACGDGAIAAFSAYRYLREQEVEI